MSDVRFLVKRYLDEGFVPMPVKPGEKATRLKAWQKSETRATVEDFGPEDNVALRLDGIVDIDCDCDETRAIAPFILPHTEMRHARPSRGVAHYFFRCEGDEDYKFKDHKNQTLIEVRSGQKQYTVVPPSRVLVDKTQPALGFEELLWDPWNQIGTIEKGQGFHYARMGAVAAQMIRCWPKAGRHHLLVALAGFLSRTDVSEREAIEILSQITLQAEGAIWDDCDPAVRDSYAKLKTDKTSGAPTIEASIGKDALAPILKWFSLKRQDPGDNGLYKLTEAGDAECFADLYKDRVRYDHRQGRWLISDPESGIWMPDPIERLTQLSVAMTRTRQKAALDLDGDRKKKAMLWAVGGESRKRLQNAQVLARSVPPISDSGEHWDEDPFLLGVQNGVVDLRAGTFRQALPEERITMRVRALFDASATCPLWIKTLDGIFAGDQAIIAFMQRALGYSITGDCREECCFFTWGDGCNGKGTMMNTLGWMLMDYTDDMPYSTLERSNRGSGIPNDVAKLDRKRFITCAEVNEFNLNEARLKALTGRDPMTARFLNHEFFTFIPVCKIWVATNNKPKITGMDDGIWRRIHLIPFTQQFTGRENKQLKDQLRDELPGILNWVIAGTQAWLAEGLNPPEAVRVATATYRQESNPITPFIETFCEEGEGRRLRAAFAFKAYEEFCHQKAIDPWMRLSDKAFHKAMRQVFKVQESRQTFYIGVSLKDDSAFRDQRTEGSEPPF